MGVRAPARRTLRRGRQRDGDHAYGRDSDDLFPKGKAVARSQRRRWVVLTPGRDDFRS